MTCLATAKADALRFVTGFEFKHGRGPSTYEVADGQFSSDLALTEGVVRSLILDRQLRRAFPTRNSKLQALAPLPVPRSPFGEPLYFVRVGGAR